MKLDYLTEITINHTTYQIYVYDVPAYEPEYYAYPDFIGDKALIRHTASASTLDRLIDYLEEETAA